MRAAIVYESRHQGNTRKLVKAIAEHHPVMLFDLGKKRGETLYRLCTEIREYDILGFASGIYVEQPSKKVKRFIENCLPEGQKTFFLYTCGSPNEKYMEPLRQAVEINQGKILGSYGCQGFYDFKLIKRNQGHPNEEEIQGAVRFYEEILKKI